MEKLKVCFLIAGFGQGGAQKQCILLMNELQKKADIELHLIYFYEDVNFSLLEQGNISLHRLHMQSAYNPMNIIKVGRCLKKINPNVIFSWLHSCDVYAFFAKKYVPKSKWVMAERDSYYPFDPRYILRNVLGVHADMIICNSQKGASYWIEKKASQKKLRVISNIVLVNEGCLIDSIQGEPVILYAGRLEKQKNVIAVTAAFISLANIFPKGKFVLVGDGSLSADIRSMIECAGCADRVIVTPFQKNIFDYYYSADVFVSISLHEGMPNTILENIALGRTVVVSAIDEHKEILGETYPYYVANLDSVSEIVGVVKSALASEMNSGIYSFANAKVESMFPKNVVNDYVRLFKEVLSDK